MIQAIRMRLLGCRVGCRIARSLRDEASCWKVKPCPIMSGQSWVECDSLAVTITPCEKCPCLRVMDHVRVYKDGSDVCLPWLARIRVRNAVRVFLLENALKGVAECKTGRCKKR